MLKLSVIFCIKKHIVFIWNSLANLDKIICNHQFSSNLLESITDRKKNEEQVTSTNDVILDFILDFV